MFFCLIEIFFPTNSRSHVFTAARAHGALLVQPVLHAAPPPPPSRISSCSPGSCRSFGWNFPDIIFSSSPSTPGLLALPLSSYKPEQLLQQHERGSSPFKPSGSSTDGQRASPKHDVAAQSVIVTAFIGEILNFYYENI